jgi:Domain of unknown function (DUF5134)
MAGPSWLAGVLAAAMILIAVYCAGRLVASRLWRRPTALDSDGLHLVMGVAMAGMIAPQLGLLPGSVWEGVFGAAATWFALRATRIGRGRAAGGWRCHYPVPHVVECGAMIYMLLAARGTRAGTPGTAMPMPGMSASGSFPACALVLALFMLGYVVWATDRLTSRARPETTVTTRNMASDPARVLITSGAAAASSLDTPGASSAERDRWEHPTGVLTLAPRLAESYKIAMSIAMGYMLVMML